MEPKTPEQLLDEALCAIQQWINDGFPETKHKFTCSAGICSAVRRYIFREYDNWGLAGLVTDVLEDEFEGHVYPFNKNGTIGYLSECNNRNVYRNKARRQWLKERTQCFFSQ